MTISIARCYPSKNRYNDYLPYDQTRIILHSTADPNASKKTSSDSSDYINATLLSKVGATQSDPPFICTQLPQQSEFNDFWSMLVQQKCEMVVCLARENEFGGKYYWPMDKASQLLLPAGRVSLQSLKETASSVQRVCGVEIDGVARTVVIFQFKVKKKGI